MNEERKGGQGRGDSANSKLQIESAAFELFEEFSKLTSKVAEAGPELRQPRPCCRNGFFFCLHPGQPKYTSRLVYGWIEIPEKNSPRLSQPEIRFLDH